MSRSMNLGLLALIGSTAVGCVWGYDEMVEDITEDSLCLVAQGLNGFTESRETERGSVLTRSLPVHVMARGAREPIEWMFYSGVEAVEEDEELPLDFVSVENNILVTESAQSCGTDETVRAYSVELWAVQSGEETIEVRFNEHIADSIDIEVRDAVTIEASGGTASTTTEDGVEPTGFACVDLADELGTQLYADRSVRWHIVSGDAMIMSRGPIADIGWEGVVNGRCIDLLDWQGQESVVLEARFGDLTTTITLEPPL